MNKMGSSTIFLALIIAFSLFCLSAFSIDVSYDGRAFKIDGERKIILSGSIHYPRSTPEVSCNHNYSAFIRNNL